MSWLTNRAKWTWSACRSANDKWSIHRCKREFCIVGQKRKYDYDNVDDTSCSRPRFNLICFICESRPPNKSLTHHPLHLLPSLAVPEIEKEAKSVSTATIFQYYNDKEEKRSEATFSYFVASSFHMFGYVRTTSREGRAERFQTHFGGRLYGQRQKAKSIEIGATMDDANVLVSDDHALPVTFAYLLNPTECCRSRLLQPNRCFARTWTNDSDSIGPLCPVHVIRKILFFTKFAHENINQSLWQEFKLLLIKCNVCNNRKERRGRTLVPASLKLHILWKS